MVGRFRLAENLAKHAVEALDGWVIGEAVDSAPSLAKDSARIVIFPDYGKIEVRLMRKVSWPDSCPREEPRYVRLDSMSTDYWSSGFLFNVVCMVSLMAQLVDDTTI